MGVKPHCRLGSIVIIRALEAFLLPMGDERSQGGHAATNHAHAKLKSVRENFSSKFFEQLVEVLTEPKGTIVQRSLEAFKA